MIRILAILLLFGALEATAQARREREWPRTFAGQPDFVFERTDVVKELEQKQKETGVAVPVITLQEMLTARPVNPIGTADAKRAKISTTAGDFVAATAGTSPTDVLMTPKDIASVDLAEFRRYLDTSLTQKLSGYKTDLKGLDFSDTLKNISVQSIVTSPIKYATINNTRYNEGDRLTLTVITKPDRQRMLELLSAELPNPDLLTADTYKQYQATVGDVLADFEAATKTGAYQKKQTLTATIAKIAPRQITLEILGKPYVLEMKWKGL